MDNPGRRDPNQFEPPPWEREQFEELSRQRAEAEAQAAAEERQAAAQAPEPQPEPEATGEPLLEEDPAADTAPPAGVVARDEVDPTVVKEMMERLRIEEPVAKSYWRVRLAVAVFIAVAGAILMIWGMVAIRAANGDQTGLFAAMVLLIFGLGFIVLAGWTAYRSLQQRGVI